MMRPLSLAERGLAQPQVSLEQLLKGQVDQVRGTCEVRLADYVQEIVGSGFPGIRPLPERVREAALDGYLAAIVEREFPEQGLTVRKPHVLTSWLRAYAAATASTATYSTILRAASPGQSDQPASSTVLAYRDVLASLWMSDLVPAWSPAFTGLRNLGKAPKHFLADPALAARLLHLSTSALLRGETKVAPLGPQAGTLLGRLFESLVALSLQTYAAAARASMSHLRTQRGEHEVDFVLERDFRVLGIEVKLSASVEDRDVGHLRWLASQWPADDLTLVVLTTGREAYTRRDGIHVIPAALLGP
jgi:predicted AAA+ superfamily ATPase